MVCLTEITELIIIINIVISVVCLDSELSVRLLSLFSTGRGEQETQEGQQPTVQLQPEHREQQYHTGTGARVLRQRRWRTLPRCCSAPNICLTLQSVMALQQCVCVSCGQAILPSVHGAIRRWRRSLWWRPPSRPYRRHSRTSRGEEQRSHLPAKLCWAYLPLDFIGFVKTGSVRLEKQQPHWDNINMGSSVSKTSSGLYHSIHQVQLQQKLLLSSFNVCDVFYYSF